MKFGMESEKIIYDLKEKKVSQSALQTLQALEDYKLLFGREEVNRVSGEFVHNIIEMRSSPHEEILEVAKDYLISYQLVRETCARNQKTLIPLGSFPVHFQPQMVSQWQYYAKNAILSKNLDVGWNLQAGQALFDCANSACVHIHTEIETLPEYLTFSRELMDKHNLATALIPFCAFASSPYFDGKSEAKSMRALRSHFGAYREVPQFGGIPPIVRSSAELLGFYQESMRDWEARAVALGFDPEENHRLTLKNGFYWGMVRWNRKRNTVEMRSLDTDLVGMDLAKFTILTNAMKRVDIQGEHLHTRILPVKEDTQDRDPAALDRLITERMSDVLEVSGSEVTIFPSALLARLTILAIHEGLSNRIVSQYVEKILQLARPNLGPTEQWMAAPIFQTISDGTTTSERILKLANRKKNLRKEDADLIIQEVLAIEYTQFERLREALPIEWRLHSHPGFGPSLPIEAPIIRRPLDGGRTEVRLGPPSS